MLNRMKKFNVNQNEAESVVGEDMNNSSIYLPKWSTIIKKSRKISRSP